MNIFGFTVIATEKYEDDIKDYKDKILDLETTITLLEHTNRNQFEQLERIRIDKIRRSKAAKAQPRKNGKFGKK
jgi:hypothetical protein